jgi:hypothetical protein
MLFGDAVLGSNVLGSTEALTVTPTPTPTNPLLGGGGSRRKWKKEKWERVRDEDFDSDITPEPLDIEPAAETKIPDPPRPMVARGPALPEPQTFEPPVPWTPTVEDTDAITQRHLARVAAVQAARERIRVAQEAQQARVVAERQRQARARHDASMISLLLQLDDL